MTMQEQPADNTQSDDPKRKIKFLVLGAYSFGNGETYEEAMQNNRDAGGEKWCVVYMWTGPEYPHKAFGHPFGFEWEGTTSRPVLIQDNRRAADKKKLPKVIGQEVA